MLSPGTIVMVSSAAMQHDPIVYPGWNKFMLKLCDKPMTIQAYADTESECKCYFLKEDSEGWMWSERWMTLLTAKITQTEINQLLTGN